MAVILVVDDEMGIRELLKEILADEGHDVRLADSAHAARELRVRERPDLVLLDIWMPDVDGISLLKDWAANGQLTMPVVMMSGHASIDSAVEATRIGAVDFLEKPVALQKLLATVKRALARPATTASLGLTVASLGRSTRMADLRKRLQSLAQVQSPVLLRGEPGTQPELYARALQQPGTPFINATASLAEAHPDLLTRAAGGIVFVDDMMALSRAQLKGLSFLFTRPERSAMRFVYFASSDPTRLAEDGLIEGGLLARLSEVIFVIPPLRQHAEDIPELASICLAQLVEARVCPPRRMSTPALNYLRNYPWPRNLEQLQQVIRSLALTALEEDISSNDVERLLAQFTEPGTRVAAPPPPAFDFNQPLREARDAFERAYFEHLLTVENGSISRVAERSGMERTHLYRKLRQLGVSTAKRDD